MESKKTHITYIFGYGRTDLIESNKKYATEFFYCYFDFLNEFKNVNYIEFKNNSISKPTGRILKFFSKVLRKVSKLSFFFENICTFSNFKKLLNTENIVLTNDRMGLSLLPFLVIYKIFKINKSTVIVMGLLAKETSNLFSHICQRFLLKIFFRTVDNFIFLSKGECQQAKVSYKKFRNKFTFIPFCIDTNFWDPDEFEKTKDKVIFVGNDGRREYDLVLDIALKIPDVEFILVTSEIRHEDIKSSNVKLYEGSWNKQILSDDELKSLYSKATLSIIPIKNSYQPSGQSVALQSMSMGIPVVITDTVGFWDKELFKDKENIYFIQNNNINNWIEKIKLILKNKETASSVKKSAKSLVSENYRTDIFYNSIKKIIFD